MSNISKLSKLTGSKRTQVLPKSDSKRRKLNENDNNSIIKPPAFHNTFIGNALPTLEEEDEDDDISATTTGGGSSIVTVSKAIGGATGASTTVTDATEKNESKKLKESINDSDNGIEENDDNDDYNDYLPFLFKREKKSLSKMKFIEINNLQTKNMILEKYHSVADDLTSIIKQMIKYFQVNYEFYLKVDMDDIDNQKNLLMGFHLEKEKLNKMKKKNLNLVLLKKLLKLRPFLNLKIMIKQNDTFLQLKDINDKLYLTCAYAFRIKTLRSYYENYGIFLYNCKNDIQYTSMGIIDNDFSSKIKKLLKNNSFNENIKKKMTKLLDEKIVKLENEIKKEKKKELKLKKMNENEKKNQNKNDGKFENGTNANAQRDIKNIVNYISGSGEMNISGFNFQ